MNALKTYFHSVGLKLPSENLVVLIKNRKESTVEKDKREFEKIKETKDKWLRIYEKYKEKYSSFSQPPEAHSTPRVVKDTSIVSEKEVDLIESSELETTPEEMPKKGHHEAPKHRQQNADEKSETFNNHTDAAESFEFVAGSHHRHRKQLSKDFVDTTESSYETEKSGESGHKKQDEISNFDDSLKVAIALLNSLLEARNMKPELKRALAAKVIQKIVQIQTSRSIQTSTLESSGFYPISASSTTSEKSSRSAVTTKNALSPRSKRNDEAIKKCFEPSTLSEMKQQSRESSARSQKDSSSSKSLMEMMKREKTSHLKWIEKEIAHLRSLRELLCKNDSTTSDASNPIYENVGGTIPNSQPAEFAVPKAPPQPDPPIYASTKWNSHVNNRKTHKTSRGKLQTPPANQESNNIADLIYDRNKKLVEKYEEVTKAYEQINVYTKPRAQPKKSTSSQQQHRPKSEKATTQDVHTSTSLASSSVFDSKSTDMGIVRRRPTSSRRVEPLPLAPIHPQNSVETQTSDTIYRTKPFFETKELHESDYYDLSAKGTVKRVPSSRNDKRLQARPPSIRYTLSFERHNRIATRPFMSLPTAAASHCSEEFSAEITSKSSKNRINSARSINGSEKATTVDDIGGVSAGDNKENADTNTYDDESKYEEIDLKSWFNSNRPDVYGRFEERRKCIGELKKLR